MHEVPCPPVEIGGCMARQSLAEIPAPVAQGLAHCRDRGVVAEISFEYAKQSEIEMPPRFVGPLQGGLEIGGVGAHRPLLYSKIARHDLSDSRSLTLRDTL